MHLAYYPAFRFCLIWIVGILYNQYFHQKGLLLIGSTFILLGLTLWFLRSGSKLFNFSVYFLLFLLSILNSKFSSSRSEHRVLGEQLYHIEISDYSKVNDSVGRIYGYAQLIDSHQSQNRIFQFYSVLSPSEKLNYKNLLDQSSFLIYAEAHVLLECPNPSYFNFHEYLKRKGVKAKLNMGSNSLFKPYDTKHAYLTKIQNYFKSKILNWHISQEAKSVYLALLLGDKSLLSSSTKEKFKSSSLMHVLVVSGMHLGLIYVILEFLFSKIRRMKRLLKPIIIITLLWSFTAISGFGIASIRAAIMLSLLAMSEVLKRPNNSINTLLASALIILLIWPSQLFELGFQLSFLAVFSLVLTYPSLNKLIHSKFVVAEFVLAGIKMALSVHILLWPVLIYHFGSLNFIFLLSSLVAVILIPLMMYLGILNLIIGSVYDFELLHFSLDYLYNLLNQSLVLFESLEFLKLSFTFRSFIGFAFAIGVFFFFSLYLKYKRIVLLSISLIGFVSCNLFWLQQNSNVEEPSIWLYAFEDNLLVSQWNGKEYYALTDSSGIKRAARVLSSHKMNAQGMIACYDCSESWDSLAYKGLISAGEYTFQIVNKKQPMLEVDYWFVGSREYPKNYGKYPFKALILNSWMGEYQKKLWEEWALKNGVKVYSLKDGALRII